MSWIRHEECVDIEIDLRDYIDEIAQFVMKNQEVREKIKASCPSFFLDSEKRKNYEIKKPENAFALSSIERSIHVSSLDFSRQNISGHFLFVKDGEIHAICSTNGHRMIFTAKDIKSFISEISNFKIHTIENIDSNIAPVKTLTSLFFNNEKCYSGIEIEDKFCIDNLSLDINNLPELNKFCCIPEDSKEFLQNFELNESHRDYSIEGRTIAEKVLSENLIKLFSEEKFQCEKDQKERASKALKVWSKRNLILLMPGRR